MATFGEKIIKVMSHTCIIGIGSNTNREENIRLAHEFLDSTFPDIVYGGEMTTEPINMSINKSLFTNQIARFTTSLSLCEIEKTLKGIEQKCGRKKEQKAEEIILIDLDLIIFDEEIIRPNDYMRKHVKEGIREICPQ